MELKSTVVQAADFVNPLISSPGGPLEGMAMASSFEPSLMPRTSMQQGIMMGLAGLTARSLVAIAEQGTRRVTPNSAGLSVKLAIRGAIAAAGTGMTMIPKQPGESLWRSGVRSGGQLLTAAAISGALYDAGGSIAGDRRSGGMLRPLLASAAITGGMVALAGKNLKERKQVIKRWPVEQKNELPMALGIGWATYAAGAGLGKGYVASRNGLVGYLGPGPTKR
ncbi:MAG: hypothetical protein U9N78_06250, partial [Actinomycetota bacterium]|nr:hypothetical protein [Actinomycetota bacterium]